MRIFVISIIFFALSISSSQADSNDVASYLLKKLRHSDSIERCLYEILAPIRRNKFNRVSVNQESIDLMRKEYTANQRANQVLRLLKFDLNGNNFVTKDEMKLLLTASDVKDIDGKLMRNMQYDTNNDKKIDFQEMQALSQRSQTNYQLRELAELLKLDPNNDGELTIQELTDMVSEAFNKYDADNDGFLSLPEKSLVSNILKQRQNIAHNN